MIQVQGLTRQFGKFRALEDVSFQVREGETLALLGPNGSGKTTTLKAIAGLVPPTAGRILVGGRDVWRDGVRARRLFSYLPQKVAFPEHLSAREVLEFYCRLRKLPARRAAEALERSGLGGAGAKPVGEFSGGMTQRLGIAVTLMAGAPVVMLDEPTASLDPDGAAALRDMLAALKREGRTILFSSHVLGDVQSLADRAAILVQGKLLRVHTMAALQSELRRRCRTLASLANPDERFARLAVRAGAEHARLEGRQLVIVAAPEDRVAILHAIEVAGGVLEGFATAECSVEQMYRQEIHEQSCSRSSTGDGGMPERSPAAHCH